MLKIIIIVSIFIASLGLEAQESTFPNLPFQTLNKADAKTVIVYTRLDGSEYEKIKGKNIWSEKSYLSEKPNSIMHSFAQEQKTEIVYPRMDGQTYISYDMKDWFDSESPELIASPQEDLAELTPSYQVIIAPNPAHGVFTINLNLVESKNVHIQLATLDGFVFGEIVNTNFAKGMQSIEVDSERFYNGEYLLFVKTGSVTQSHRISIKN